MDYEQAIDFYNHLPTHDLEDLKRFYNVSYLGSREIIDTYDRFKRGEYQEESLPIILIPFFLATDIRNDLNSKNSKDQYRTNAILKDLNSFIDFINQYAEIFGYRYRADNPYDLEQDKIFKIIMWAGMWEPGDNGDIVILKEKYMFAADDLTYDEANDEFYFRGGERAYDAWSKITTDGEYTKINSATGPIIASYYGYIYYINGNNIVYSNASDLNNFEIFAPLVAVRFGGHDDMDGYYKLNRNGELFFIINSYIYKYNFDTNEYYSIYNIEYGEIKVVITLEDGGLLCKLRDSNFLKLNNLNGQYEMVLYELELEEQNISNIYSMAVDNYNRIFGFVLYKNGQLRFDKFELINGKNSNYVSIVNIVFTIGNSMYGYTGNGFSWMTNIYFAPSYSYYEMVIDKHGNAVLSAHSKIIKLYLDMPSGQMVKSAVY